MFRVEEGKWMDEIHAMPSIYCYFLYHTACKFSVVRTFHNTSLKWFKNVLQKLVRLLRSPTATVKSVDVQVQNQTHKFPLRMKRQFNSGLSDVSKEFKQSFRKGLLSLIIGLESKSKCLNLWRQIISCNIN